MQVIQGHHFPCHSKVVYATCDFLCVNNSNLPLLFCTVSETSRIIGQIFSVDILGFLCLTGSFCGELLNS